jgi:DNA-binding MarR family transcriptional regulator
MAGERSMVEPDRVPDAEAMALAEELRRTLGTFVRTVRRTAGTPSSAQAETLGLLDRNGPANVAMLAQRRGVTHQSMRLTAAQLESAALVRREADPVDGRSQILTLTDEGRAQLTRGRRARNSVIAQLIEQELTADERRTLRDAVALLARLNAARPGEVVSQP